MSIIPFPRSREQDLGTMQHLSELIGDLVERAREMQGKRKPPVSADGHEGLETHRPLRLVSPDRRSD